ncbi:transposase family protein [Pontiella sulfatireligans]|nr:transposase family protein [Pontiella sulfatireligans]
MPNPREQQILDRLTIRLIRRDEHGRYEQLIDEQHCLKSAQLVGEQLRYVVEDDGGWSAEQRRIRLLCAEQMPELWAGDKLEGKLRCRAKAAELRSIREHFAGMEDYRKGHNWPYTLSGLYTLAFCASLAGVSSGQRDLAEYARDIGQGQLRALGFRQNRKTSEIPAPAKPPSSVC